MSNDQYEELKEFKYKMDRSEVSALFNQIYFKEKILLRPTHTHTDIYIYTYIYICVCVCVCVCVCNLVQIPLTFLRLFANAVVLISRVWLKYHHHVALPDSLSPPVSIIHLLYIDPRPRRQSRDAPVYISGRTVEAGGH